MERVVTDYSQVSKLVETLRACSLRSEYDRTNHASVHWKEAMLLANSYFALVSICHQTSPLGERRLEGVVGNVKKAGWDYLKERFLEKVRQDAEWATPEYWRVLRPADLSELFDDPVFGKTLNRVNERAFLLNDAGDRLRKSGCHNVKEPFNECHGFIGGESGFLVFLKTFEAYKDPVMKKAHLFLALMENELGWVIRDPEHLLSPVDYHEMRGHLRMGTILVQDPGLASKVQRGLTLTDDEDCEIRSKIQRVNSFISNQTGLSVPVIHSLFWNVFRNCCPRASGETHCSDCGGNCGLPSPYKKMDTYRNRCMFSAFCHAAGKTDKVIDPPYAGHYY